MVHVSTGRSIPAATSNELGNEKRINCHHRFRKLQWSRLEPCDNIFVKNSTFFSQGETTTNIGTFDLNEGSHKKQWATTEQQIAQKAYEPG